MNLFIDCSINLLVSKKSSVIINLVVSSHKLSSYVILKGSLSIHTILYGYFSSLLHKAYLMFY